MLLTLDSLGAGEESSHDEFRDSVERFARSVDERCEQLKHQVCAAVELSELLRRRCSLHASIDGRA